MRAALAALAVVSLFGIVGAILALGLMLRGVGMTEKELEILGISHAGE